jgi:hypothetical protein
MEVAQRHTTKSINIFPSWYILYCQVHTTFMSSASHRLCLWSENGSHEFMLVHSTLVVVCLTRPEFFLPSPAQSADLIRACSDLAHRRLVYMRSSLGSKNQTQNNSDQHKWTKQFIWYIFQLGNISGANQPLRANYGNFNLNHMMLNQRKTYGRWEGWCAKLMRGGRDDLQMHFCKSPLPPPMSPSLDQYRVARIEVSIICTKGSVSTWYVPFQLRPNGSSRLARTRLGESPGNTYRIVIMGASKQQFFSCPDKYSSLQL